jgi:hypothetical protein
LEKKRSPENRAALANQRNSLVRSSLALVTSMLVLPAWVPGLLIGNVVGLGADATAAAAAAVKGPSS